MYFEDKSTTVHFVALYETQGGLIYTSRIHLGTLPKSGSEVFSLLTVAGWYLSLTYTTNQD